MNFCWLILITILCCSSLSATSRTTATFSDSNAPSASGMQVTPRARPPLMGKTGKATTSTIRPSALTSSLTATADAGRGAFKRRSSKSPANAGAGAGCSEPELEMPSRPPLLLKRQSSSMDTTSPIEDKDEEKAFNFKLFTGDVRLLEPWSPEKLEAFTTVIIRLPDNKYVYAQAQPTLYITSLTECDTKTLRPECLLLQAEPNDTVFLYSNNENLNEPAYSTVDAEGYSDIVNLLVISEDDYKTCVFKVPSN